MDLFNLAHYQAVKGREGRSLQFNLSINVGVWWYYSVSETQIFLDKDMKSSLKKRRRMKAMMILERERELREGRIPCSSEGVSLKLHFVLFHCVSLCTFVLLYLCIMVSLKLHFGLFHCVSLCSMFFCIVVSYNIFIIVSLKLLFGLYVFHYVLLCHCIFV